MACELESNLQDTMDWDKNWLVDLNAGKTQLVSSDWCNNSGAIDLKMSESVLEEKSYFKMLKATFLSKWIGALTLFLLLKVPPRKLGLLRLLCISMNRPCIECCCHVWAGTLSCYL